jgi:ATP synthase F1 delta subunit|uniref:ATP synthase CF1 delta subunit n=1 Tax=Gonyostomum semen TaxID=375454 RepID=UPI002114740F|nr:ATP synthase CF1 delta subunit [Gonyostomum semen]UTE94387.1 ATP synthase CF1 delta subunit [Gonyostomum semen]
MGLSSRVGDAYAYAFLKVIYKDLTFSTFTHLVSDMLDFSTLFNAYPSIEKFLANPTYDAKKKKQFLNEFFGNSLNPLIMNFLNLLCDTKRIIYLDSILKVFLELLLKSTNSYIIEIQIPNSQNYKVDINKLNIILSNWFIKNKKDVSFEKINFACFKEPLIIYTIKQKPELLGGFILNFLTESKTVDFSIAGKIEKITKVLEY